MLCVCVCVCMGVCACVHACVRVCVCVCMHVCVYVCMCGMYGYGYCIFYVHTNMCICLYVRALINLKNLQKDFVVRR